MKKIRIFNILSEFCQNYDLKYKNSTFLVKFVMISIVTDLLQILCRYLRMEDEL